MVDFNYLSLNWWVYRISAINSMMNPKRKKMMVPNLGGPKNREWGNEIPSFPTSRASQ